MPATILRWFGMLTLGALALGAQELPPSLPASTFGGSIDIRVINMEAVVTGPGGERVRGLSANDFVLEVDGQEVPVEYFAEMAGGRTAASPSPAAPAAADAAPPPEASQAPVGRSLLVFIDDFFSIANQRDRMLDALEKSLNLLGPEDRMAIVAFLHGRVDVLSGWTSDPKALAAALQAARKRPAKGIKLLADRREGIEDDLLVQAAQAASGGGIEESFSGTRGLSPMVSAPAGPGVGTLEFRQGGIARAAMAAMSALAPASGRRTLLLFSGGLPTPQSYGLLALAANRLGYTIYPVDVQGIDITMASNDASLERPLGTDGFITSPLQQESQYHLEMLAKATGGKALLNSAGITALGSVMEDTGSYYWLGFTPTWKGEDRFHRIAVKARRKGLKVRSQTAVADFSRTTQATLAAQGLLLVGGDARTKRLALAVEPLSRQRKTLEVEVTVAVPVADLTPIEQDGGKWKVEATLSSAALDKAGDFSDLHEVPLHLTLPRKPAPGDFARYHTKMKLSRIQQRLVVTVRDPLGGAAVWGEAEINP